jgi:hypothetical protein
MKSRCSNLNLISLVLMSLYCDRSKAALYAHPSQAFSCEGVVLKVDARLYRHAYQTFLILPASSNGGDSFIS